MSKYRITYKEFTSGELMRKRILSICHQLGWTVISEKTGKLVVDLPRLNAFITSDKGGFEWELNSLLPTELQKLISKFEIMLEKHLKASTSCEK